MTKEIVESAGSIQSAHVIFIRDQPVLFASSVAEAFAVETREVNQAVKRNPKKFNDNHAFQLTSEETDSLRSQGVIPKLMRGGSREPPWVFTQKGVVRLVTVITSPKALEATDLFIDVFVEVYRQIAQGQHQVAISNPSKLLPAPAQGKEVRAFRAKLLEAMNGLLDTVIDPKSHSTVGDELGDISNRALNHVKERLRTKGIENEKLAADTALILEKVREIRDRTRAEVRKTDAETERIMLENLDQKISIVERLLNMTDRLEPNAMVDLLGNFAPAGLPRAQDTLAIEHRNGTDDDATPSNRVGNDE